MILTEKPPLREVYLEHDGVKGMRWGYRKREEPSGPRQRGAPAAPKSKGMSPRNQKFVTGAAVLGTVAIGAVLLSRGNVSVWNSGATKIALGGAKASGKIIGKTGSVIVKGSAKTAMVTGKVALKTGTVAGKAAARGSVAAGKGIATSARTNGANLFETVIKPSAKMSTRLGSGAMFKLTGRGTPFVAETLQRKTSFNPVDILLNTKADYKGGFR